jgi:hypothetical protein
MSSLAQTTVSPPDLSKSGETFHAGPPPDLDKWVHAEPGSPRWKYPDLALFYDTLDGEYSWQGLDGQLHTGKSRPPDSQIQKQAGWADDDD